MIFTRLTEEPVERNIGIIERILFNFNFIYFSGDFKFN